MNHSEGYVRKIIWKKVLRLVGLFCRAPTHLRPLTWLSRRPTEEKVIEEVECGRSTPINLEKDRLIEQFQSTVWEPMTVELVRQRSVIPTCEKYLGQSKTGWRNHENKQKTLEKAAPDRRKHLKNSTSGGKYAKFPFWIGVN